MARTHSQPATAAPATAAPATTPRAASSTRRVTKTRSERSLHSRSCVTRQRTKMLAEASSSGRLQPLLDEAPAVAGSRAGSSSSAKGKGKAKDAVPQSGEWPDYAELTSGALSVPQRTAEAVGPIVRQDSTPFPIMDLPTEIRLEVYRACLTRPYNILLSRQEQQVFAEAGEDGDAGGDTVAADPSSHDDGRTGVGPVASIRPLRSSATAQHSGQSSSRPSNVSQTPPLPRRTSRWARALRTPRASGPSQAPTAANPSRPAHRTAEPRSKQAIASGPERPQNQDPLIVNIMLASREIYKEARSVLYGENSFTLDLATAMPTLACLHQRSRRQIKHVELEIPTYSEILERFQETVRLSLRYCSGLNIFVIHMPFTLPGADGSGTTGNTTVYANGFDILRWLPQECHVILKGSICAEIETVVNKHLHLAKTLDKNAYARRQLISNDTGSST